MEHNLGSVTVLGFLKLFSFFNLKKIIFGCAGSLLLGRLLSSCGGAGVIPASVHRLLTVVASLVGEHGLWSTRAQ